MSIEHTEGLVLRTYDYSETSKIAVVFSKKFGKIKVMAKGAKGKNSKTSAIIEPGTHAKIIFYLKREGDLFTLSEASIISQFGKIRSDLLKFACMMYILELIDSLFEHEEGGEKFFDVMIDLIKKLETAEEPDLVVRAIEVKILDVLGHRLQFDRCVGCGKSVPQGLIPKNFRDATGAKSFNLSISHGGILCKGCSARAINKKKCSGEFIAVFEYLTGASSEDISGLKLSQIQRDELKNILRNDIDFLLGKGLKSLSFLEKCGSTRFSRHFS